MTLNDIRIMRGPNMWSPVFHQLLAIKFFPLEESRGIDDERKKQLVDHFRNTYSIESDQDDLELALFQCALELTARLQGSPLYTDILYPSPDIAYGIVQYNVEQAGVAAVNLASGIINSLLNNEEPIVFEDACQEVQRVAQKYGEGPTTSLIIKAAKARNIPVSSGPAGYTIFGYGKKQQRISAAMSHNTSCIAVNIAGNKESTKKFLESASIPVPKGIVTADEYELPKTAERLGYPLVTKPFNGNQGRNVTCGIMNMESLIAGFRHAQEASRRVIIEKEIRGHDYRLLVIGNKFVAASMRLPAFVTGDGFSSLAALVEIENSDPRRGNGHENMLTKIKLDASTDLMLEKLGMDRNSIPENGTRIYLKHTANLSTGGTAEDVTDTVHPYNRMLAERVARTINLDICGIDFISEDISVPITENHGAVIEVNAAPGLRMHAFPNKGRSREVGAPIVDLMFEQGEEGRIPIVAITGTNGKTTTTRLMAHIAGFAGKTVGFSSTDGIYIGTEKIKEGDCSGPQSAATILQDMTVDFAVLECARGGIIRSGLGFDQCDIAIVTNVAADHLGLKDIYTVADLAAVKAVVPASVKKDGWAILNAGEEHSHAMKDKVRCNVALFSTDENNANFQKHLQNGGCGIYTDGKKDIYVTSGGRKTLIGNAAEAPITRNGKAGFMIENLLPATLAAWLLGFDGDTIKRAVADFIPNAEQTPGRINEFFINGVNVIVDYAHNPHGMRALSGYLDNIEAKKLGIITGTGDRREEDIMEFARIAAATYDEIIVRFDRDLRGRSQESIIELLANGFHQVKPDFEFLVIPDTQTAIHHAVANAEKGSYVVICADNASYTVGLTKNVAMQFGK